MSCNEIPTLEKLDLDLIKFERRTSLSEDDENNLDEFVGQLQEAFSFANKADLDEQLIFIAIEKTFKEYFDCASIEIRTDYNKILKLLKIGA